MATKVLNVQLKMSATGGAPISVIAGKYVCDAETSLILVIPANTTDKEFDVVFPYDTIQLCMLVPTGLANGDCTVKVNSTSAPVPQLNLKMNQGMAWANDQPHPNPFTANVTKFYVTNPNTSDINLECKVCYNLKP